MSQLSKYNIDATFFNESITSWVDVIHTRLSAQYEMPKIRIRPGKYGFDAYASVLSTVLSNVSMNDIMSAMRGQLDISRFIELSHIAWIDNYIHWKQIRSDELSDDPKKTINTILRNDRATTNVRNLNSVDLDMYRDIINAVLDVLTKKIIEAGMQNMSL